MTLNSNLYDVEKYQLKWLRVLYCVRGLGFKSLYANCVLFICYYF